MLRDSNIQVSLLAGLLFMLVSCGSNVSEPNDVAGTYVLARFAGASIPADRGFVVGRDGTPTNCRIVVAVGELRLVEAGRQFTYSYELRNSCDGSTIGNPVAIGTYIDAANGLRFLLNGDPQFQLDVLVSADTITVLDVETLEFVRPDR